MTFPRPGDIAEVLSAHGHDDAPTLDALLDGFYRATRTLDGLDAPPEDPGVWWWSTWLGGAGVPGPVARDAAPNLVDRLRWVHRLEGVIETLHGLRDRGIPVAVVSNASGHVATELEEIGASPYLSAIIDSSVVGVAKPDPRIFALALEQLGVEAADAVHVGDVYSIDVTGAIAAGVRPVHLDPFALYDHGEQRIGRLTDLLDLIDG